MQSIQKLHSSTGHNLRSQYLYPSFCRAATRLVEAALASASSRIDISIHFRNFELSVSDNGKGLDEAEMAALRSAWLAQGCSTSTTTECSATNVALLAHIGDLHIISKKAGKTQTFGLELPHPCTLLACNPRNSCGTCVRLTSFFKGCPVRRASLNIRRETESIQQLTIGIAVAQYDIDFSLTTDTSLHLELPGRGSIKERIQQIFGKDAASRFGECAAAGENAKVDGIIGKPTEGGEMRRIRFLSANGRPVQCPIITSFIDISLHKICPPTEIKAKKQRGKESRVQPAEFALSMEVPEGSVECLEADPWPLLCCADYMEILFILSTAIRNALCVESDSSDSDKELLATEAMKVLQLHRVETGGVYAFLTKWKELSGKQLRDETKNTEKKQTPTTTPTSVTATNSKCDASLPPNVNKTDDCACSVHHEEVSLPSPQPSLNAPWASCLLVAGGEGITHAPTRLHIRREDVSRIKIVSQVQCKFLVGLLDGAVLVAIDQHAAGERVKLEEIEDATSRLPHPSVVSFKLSTPTRIELAVHEVYLLKETASALFTLGYRTEPPLSEINESCSVTVTHVPSLLGEPLEAAALSAVAQCISQRRVCDRIAEILKMKACRFAVKFGEALTNESAAVLVAKLGKCRKPFACAHGRPTVYPLGLLQQQPRGPPR